MNAPKFALCIVCMVTVTVGVASAQGQKGCTFEGEIYEVGAVWHTSADRGCKEYACEGPNELSASSCSNFRPGHMCVKIPGDPTAEYPACCPKLYCPSHLRKNINAVRN